MQKQNGLLISVTYKCNASCPYCYIGEFRKKFPRDMGFFTFLDIVNHLIKAGDKKIYLIGGEPVLWKHLGKAIKYCHLRGLKVMIFTNGLEIIKANPDEVYVNTAYYFTRKEILTKTLDDYKKRGIKIIIRYNMAAEEAESSDVERIGRIAEKIAQLALKYQAPVHVTPTSPYSLKKKVGRNLYKFAQVVTSHGVICSVPDPVPPCVFEKDEKEFLLKNCKLYHKCGFGFRPLIHPDGETVQPCARMFLPRPIKSLDRIGKVGDVYLDKIQELESDVRLVCQDCEHFKNKKCCGGCLVPRFEEKKSVFCARA